MRRAIVKLNPRRPKGTRRRKLNLQLLRELPFLLATYGLEWARSPSVLPALSMGIVTVIAALLILQRGMGAGIASRRTPRPIFNSRKSLVTHTVFGLMYLAALATAFIPVGM